MFIEHVGTAPLDISGKFKVGDRVTWYDAFRNEHVTGTVTEVSSSGYPVVLHDNKTTTTYWNSRAMDEVFHVEPMHDLLWRTTFRSYHSVWALEFQDHWDITWVSEIK